MTRRRANIELNGQRIRGLHYWKHLRDGTIIADGHLRVGAEMPLPTGFPSGGSGVRQMHVRIADVVQLPVVDEVCRVTFSGRHVRDAGTASAVAIDGYRISRQNT